MESFNPKKLKAVEGKEQYWVEISNRFAALENLGGGTTIVFLDIIHLTVFI
jgi:hypothetical protein